MAFCAVPSADKTRSTRAAADTYLTTSTASAFWTASNTVFCSCVSGVTGVSIWVNRLKSTPAFSKTFLIHDFSTFAFRSTMMFSMVGSVRKKASSPLPLTRYPPSVLHRSSFTPQELKSACICTSSVMCCCCVFTAVSSARRTSGTVKAASMCSQCRGRCRV